MEVDPLRLEQVLSNLLDKAIKYSPAGGPIDMEAACPDAGTVRIVVADRGPGIPSEQHDRIFDRFYQADRTGHGAGMGLGLYVSREIVMLHGGSVMVKDRPGGGTTFVITLPKSTRSASTAAAPCR